MAIKPILFNTEMVRAILDGRKSCTRRLVKVPPYYPNFYKLHDNTDGALSGTRNRLYAGFYKDEQIFYIDGERHVDAVYYQAPYQQDDILYVQETWYKDKYRYMYRANYSENEKFYRGDVEEKVKWNPSIHMPKEAARIWLKVMDVRVERLQDITSEQICKEGVEVEEPYVLNGEEKRYDFSNLWNSTIKKSDFDRYGWNANPWVWVIEFERCEKPEG